MTAQPFDAEKEAMRVAKVLFDSQSEQARCAELVLRALRKGRRDAFRAGEEAMREKCAQWHVVAALELGEERKRLIGKESTLDYRLTLLDRVAEHQLSAKEIRALPIEPQQTKEGETG